MWRGVEGCGGLWRGVEGCGGVWRDVEGCGGVWKGCGRGVEGVCVGTPMQGGGGCSHGASNAICNKLLEKCKKLRESCDGISNPP